MVRRSRRLLSCAILAAACNLSGAAELGDVRVASHIGQPLVADIELAMLDDAATPVAVRIADREVYSGAGIAMPPVLSSVTLAVTRRDGRQFLHVTSARPVDADHVHLYLDLTDRGQHAVRLATLWLTPDPNPVPVAAAAPVAAPVVMPPVAPPPAAASTAPAAVRVPAAVPARPPEHPHVSAALPPVAADKVRATAMAEPVQAEPVKPAPAEAKRPLPAPAPRLVSLPPLPLALKPALADKHPPACARASADAQACVALGTKNAELRAQLGRLEDKVKRLQAQLGVTPGAPAAAAVPAPQEGKAKPKDEPKDAAKEAPDAAPKDSAGPPPQEEKPPVPAGPKPIRSIKTLVPHKPKAPPPDDSLPTSWIAGALGVLALAAAGGALVAVRRRKARNVDIPAEPGLVSRLKARLQRKKAALEAAAPAMPDPEHAEPSLE